MGSHPHRHRHATVWCPPAATNTTSPPPDRPGSTYRGAKWFSLSACPSCPCPPYPQVYTCPSSLSATVCQTPMASIMTRSPLKTAAGSVLLLLLNDAKALDDERAMRAGRCQRKAHPRLQQRRPGCARGGRRVGTTGKCAAMELRERLNDLFC